MCDCGKSSPDEAKSAHGHHAVAATAADNTHGDGTGAARDAATEASCTCAPAAGTSHHASHAGVATPA